MNEVNWAFEGGNPVGCDDVVNAPLKNLYDRAIAAIREVDTSHIIFIEGNCYANNHNGLWPFDDDNVVLSFHRYWNLNSVDTIQKYLDWVSRSEFDRQCRGHQARFLMLYSYYHTIHRATNTTFHSGWASLVKIISGGIVMP